jgi:hypothetical protein
MSFEEINDVDAFGKLIEKDDRENESLLIILLITDVLFYSDKKELSNEQIKIIIYVYNIYKEHYKLDQAFKKKVNSLKSISQRVKDIVNADTTKSTYLFYKKMFLIFLLSSVYYVVTAVFVMFAYGFMRGKYRCIHIISGFFLLALLYGMVIKKYQL